jgi:hypothetical protein
MSFVLRNHGFVNCNHNLHRIKRKLLKVNADASFHINQGMHKMTFYEIGTDMKCRTKLGNNIYSEI